MNKIPKFEDIPWNGGPEVDNRSANWRARAVALSGRSLDQLARPRLDLLLLALRFLRQPAT